MYCLHCKYTTKLRNDKEINALFAHYKGGAAVPAAPTKQTCTNITILPQIAKNFWRKIFSHRLHRFSQIRRVWHPAIPTQPPNYLPTEFAEHTETTGGEEKSVYICEICGRLFSARSFCVFCEIRGRISSTRNFCEFREFCGRTCANKLEVGSGEGIRRAAWVWQGCHTLLRKLPQIAQMCTD